MGASFPALFLRVFWRVVWSAAVAGTVLSCSLVAISGPAAAACSATSKPDRASALKLAASCKKSISVSGATTETSTLLANSNGSMTVTESVVPERVRRADGRWVPVDTTLKVNGDGSVSPVASPTAVVLSGGGTGPLARTAHDGRELIWTWTGFSLPKPTLSGEVATYPSVLPDVDLKVHVDQWGFSEVLVVKTAAAAAGPALASLRFGLSGNALSAAGAAGAATSVSEALGEGFEIGSAYLWDSTPPAEPPPASMPAVDVQSELVSTIDGPGAGAKLAPMPMAMAGTSLVIIPDAGLLKDPAAKFPIFIDPKSSSPARTYWAMINSGHKDQQYWTWDRANHAKVGNAGDGENMYRSLFQFSTADWRNKHVTDVTFSDDLVHSWTCDKTVTELHLSSKTLGSGTTWNTNASSWGGSLATVNNQNCTDAPNVSSEWRSDALTAAIHAARANTSVTIGLRAASETISHDGSNGWKKFDERSGSGGAHLSVTYNTAPVLTNLHTDAAACASTAAAAPLLSTYGSPAHNPVPQVTVTDGEADKSTVTFTYPKAGGGTSSTAYANVASGASQKLVAGIPAAAIPTGGTYSWSVRVSDGTDSSTQTCYFKVDNTVPAPPAIVTADNVYPDDGDLHGGVGKPGRFTITATGPDASKVVKYVWGPTSGGAQQTVTTTAGAAVTVSYTPPVLGDNTLQAYAYSAAGLVSAPGSVDFQVAAPGPVAGQWPLSGDGSDTTAGNHPATAANVTWTPDARQIGRSVAHLNGSTSLLSAAVPIHTNTAYAVSAWVRPAGTTCAGTAVSQDGVHTSGFYLGCYQGKFRFAMLPSDNPVASSTAFSTGTAPTGRWSNIVGVYDPSAARVSLYVNGTLQSSVPLTSSWDAAGPFVIGRERYLDAPTGWWNGDISDVRVWDRVVYQADVDTLAEASWADQFPLDDPARNTRRDNPLTWAGSPAPTIDDMNPPDGGGTPGVLLNTADTVDSATTTGPSVRTDGSFSVSAWLTPNRLTGGNQSAVAQNGTVASNFSLGISQANRYQFRMNSGDVTGPTATIVEAPGTAVVGRWVHLLGTFDFTTRQMTLYVNGLPAASLPFTGTPWHAGGPLVVGAARWKGLPVDYWCGGIDNVALFNGVLNATQIQNLYRYNDPFYVAEG